MFTLALIRDEKSSLIRLKPHEMICFPIMHALTAEEIEEGLSEGTISESFKSVYNEDELRKQGVFQIIGSRGKILWVDKSQGIVLPSDICKRIHLSPLGNVIFGNVTLQSEISNIPCNLQLQEKEHIVIEIGHSLNSFGSMTIFLRSGTFSTMMVNDVYISYDLSEVHVYCGLDKYFFKTHEYDYTMDHRPPENDRDELANILLTNIKSKLKMLEKLLDKVNNEWVFEDAIYRFYHRSFKVFRIQKYTRRIYKAIENLSPDQSMNCDFRKIIGAQINGLKQVLMRIG